MVISPLDRNIFMAMNTFGELFRKYRLKVSFVSLSEFADAFSQKGFCYEVSIFSHWQQGSRVPTKRVVLLALLALLMERRAIASLSEANEFLESAGHGYLTLREQKQLRMHTLFTRVGSL